MCRRQVHRAALAAACLAGVWACGPGAGPDARAPVRLADRAGGPAWLGLGGVYHETLPVRAGEAVTVDASLPLEPRLDVFVGTREPGAVTFRVAVEPTGGSPVTVLQRTVTRPGRWEWVRADLAGFAGDAVRLELSVQAAERGTVGLFGSPVVRARPAEATRRPQVAVLVLADGVRSDHLDAYGYRRATAPNLARAAEEGVVFRDVVAQASDGAISAASLLTGLYPHAHGVTGPDAPLVADSFTLAGAFRAAGYATLGFSSDDAIGAATGLHRGFESLHEGPSLGLAHGDTQTAGPQLDRLFAWLEDHPQTPVFALLQARDARAPFEPKPPYDRIWADAAAREAHLADLERARPEIADPRSRRLGAPSESALARAGVDAVAFIEHEIDWYDGSIRGLDAELVRLFERLRALGLAERSLVVFTSSHGTEFHEHGRMLHGHSLHAELLEVPLVLWGPGRVPVGRRVDALVRSIDVLPTVLELAGLPVPRGLHGRSLVSYLRDLEFPPPDEPGFAEQPGAGGSAGAEAVVTGRFKLIRHARPAPGAPEFELYDRVEDPLERRNLAESLPDVVARMAGQLDAWRAETRGREAGPD